MSAEAHSSFVMAETSPVLEDLALIPFATVAIFFPQTCVAPYQQSSVQLLASFLCSTPKSDVIIILTCIIF